MPKAYGVIRSA